jgi:hypothetical protein
MTRWLADKGARVRADLLVDARERCRAAAAGAFDLFDSFARRAAERAECALAAET